MYTPRGYQEVRLTPEGGGAPLGRRRQRRTCAHDPRADHRRRRAARALRAARRRSTSTSARCERSGAGGWCSSPARPASARRRSCGRFCESRGRDAAALGRLRRAVHAAPARAVPRHRRRGRRRARGVAADGAPPAGSSPRWRASCAARPPASSCSRTCTGPTRRRSTSCACSPGASSRPRAGARRPTATTSSIAPTRCGSCSASCPPDGVERLGLPPLSVEAVADARRVERLDADALHRRTAGNPFFVTEVLAARDAELPDDRARRGAGPRRAPRRRRRGGCWTPSPSSRRASSCGCSRRWPAATSATLDACLASGMLRAERDAVGFRHEIARVAVEEALSPHRRLPLHRAALAALAAARRARRPRPPRAPRRGRRRRRRGAALRAAPPASAPRRSASHREAAAQFARALRYAHGLPRERRAELLERRSYECYLTDDIAGRRRGAARGAGRAPRGRRPPARGRRPPLAVAAGLVLGRQRDGRGRGARGGRAARAARRPDRELAMAYSNWRSCGCWPATSRRAIDWGDARDRARRAARRDRDPRPRAEQRGHRRAASRARRRGREARAQPRAGARRRARGARRPRVHEPGLGPRGGCATTRSRDRHLEAGIAYCAEHDLDSWRLYMMGWRARSELDQGRLGRAPPRAPPRCSGSRASPRRPRITPLMVVGRLRARRGRPRPVVAARRGARARAPHRRAAAPGARSPAPAPRRAGWPATTRRSRPRPTPTLALALDCATAGPAASCTSGAGARASPTS